MRALNPLAKVPTLVTDDGEVPFESAVICDYLDALAPPWRRYPADTSTNGLTRWQALRWQGMADGACPAATRLYADEPRPGHERCAAMMARSRVAIGHVAVAALPGYLDFR